MTSSGPTHSRARRLLGRFFVRSTLEKETENITKLVDTCVDEFLRTGKDDPVDVQDLFHFAMLQVFGISMLGADIFRLCTRGCPLLGCKEQRDARKALFHAVRGEEKKIPTRDPFAALDEEYYLNEGEVLTWCSGEVSYGSNKIGLHMAYGIPMTKMLPHVRRLGVTTSLLHVLFQVMIDARRIAIQKFGDKVPDDCLTALVKAADEGDESGLPRLTDEQVCHQLVTLMSAGHDTTAFMCCYAAYELAKHPKIQDDLRRELGADEFDFSTSVLKRVLQETLRLYPTIPMVQRIAANNVNIPGDLHITKGTKVIVPFFILNRQPGVWGKDAAEFKPDRWIDISTSDGLMQPKLGFLPFAYGSRTCIGYNLALVEAKIIFQRLLQKYDILPVPNFKPRILSGVSLTVENPHGIKVLFKQRPSSPRGF